MSGVLANGIRYERCNGCGEWVAINNLTQEKPSEEFPYGRDLGPCCAEH